MAYELIVDSFAGGGGASVGIELALGRSPDIAINHDAEALDMHAANHPATRHLPANIWKVDPVAAMRGRPVGLLWASPDCKHFSKAKGGKPVEQNIRDLAWVVVRWARQVAPRIIILENVEEFATWGPLAEDGRPCPDRRGLTFKRWVRELRRLGYRVDWRELVAADYGAPTIRKRLFLIARRDGEPIVWPAPTHGRPGSPDVVSGAREPWRAAAEIIDWSLPCHSIFLTTAEGRAVGVKRPLVPATMARIAKGIDRYVLKAAEPFIVPITHSGDARTYAMREPLRTVTTAHRGEQALVTPFIAGVGGRMGQSPERPVDKPLQTMTAKADSVVVTAHLSRQFGHSIGAAADDPIGTVTAGGGGKTALVAAFLAQHNTGVVGHDARAPVSTITQRGTNQAVVSAGLVNLKGSDRRGSAADGPVPTQTAGGWHLAEVRAFLIKYFGSDQDPRLEVPLHTCTTKHRFGLVTVHGEPYQIVDIGMRMLTPRELFRAQGFPDSYRIDRTTADEPISKTAQVRMCGNSVCPPVAAAIVAANFAAREIGSPHAAPEFQLEAAE